MICSKIINSDYNLDKPLLFDITTLFDGKTKETDLYIMTNKNQVEDTVDQNSPSLISTLISKYIEVYYNNKETDKNIKLLFSYNEKKEIKENKDEYDTYSIDNNSELNISLLKNRCTYTHKDCSISSNSLKVDINHILLSQNLLNEKNDYCLGKGWKLNLNQKLYNEDNKIIYLDENDLKHVFKEKWYYLDENKNEVLVDKNNIYLDVDGKLKYIKNGHFLEIKYKVENDEGLELIKASSLNNYKNFNYSIDKLIFQIVFLDNSIYEDIFESSDTVNVPLYKEQVGNNEEYISYDEINLSTMKSIRNNNIVSKKISMFKIQVDEKGFFFSPTDNDKYKTRLLIRPVYQETGFKLDNIYLTEEISQLQQAINDINQTITSYLNAYKMTLDNINNLNYQSNTYDDIVSNTKKIRDIQNNILNYNNEIFNTKRNFFITFYRHYYPLKIKNLQKYKNNDKIIVLDMENIDYDKLENYTINLVNENSNNDTYLKDYLQAITLAMEYFNYEFELKTKNANETINNLNLSNEEKQMYGTSNNYYFQNQQLLKQAKQNLQSIKELVFKLNQYKKQYDYLIQEQYKQVNNIIVDKEENILGFDGYGRLIQIQDKYENKIEIEYNYEEENLNQIKRIYSSNEEIKLNYDKKTKLLMSIIDNKGKLIRYFYNGDNLQYIVYPELDKANKPLTTSLQIDSNHIEIITPLFEMFSAVMNDNIIDVQKGYLNLSYDTLYIDDKTVIKGFDKKLVEHIHYEYQENQTIVNNPKLETQTIYEFDDNGNIYGKSVNEEYEYSFIQDELVLFKSYLGAPSKIESGTIEGDNEVKTFTLSSTKPLVLCLNFHEENELNLRIESGNRIFNQNIKITNTKPIYIPFFVDRLKSTNVKMTFKLKNSAGFDYIIYKGKDGELYNYNDKKIILKQTLLYDEEYEYEDDLLVKQINKNIYNEKVVTTYSYNPNKLLTLIEDSKGNVQEYHYDEKGNCIETKSYNKEDASLMKIEKNSYDEKGNVIFSEGPIKNKENKYPKQEIKYVNNLVNKIIGYNNETIVYNYDYNNGNLLSISSSVDGTNNSTAFTYNYGLLTSMSNQSMKIEYGYDGKKRRVLTKLNGLEYLKTIYEDHDNSRITIVNITYDGLKTIQEISEEKLMFQNIVGDDGEINLNYNYDGEDRLLAVDYIVNVSNNSYRGVEEYDYNEFDILSRYQKYINNNLELKIENIYDENYRYLISKNTSFLNYNIKEEYTYNDKNQINKVDLSLNKDKIITLLKYDSLNRIKHQHIINDAVNYCHEYSYLQQDENSLDLISEDILKIKIENKQEYYIETNKYQYDVNGNIINIAQDDVETKYTYDSINRLVQEENPLLNKTIKYKYDKVGNIILTKEYDNKSKELILTKEYIYDCDNQDRLISFNNEMISYDEMGRPLIYRNKKLTWNNQNQLLRINNDINYIYDVNGIRSYKLVKGIETRYITQNNQIICEENNNGIIIYQYILNKLVGFTYTTSSGTKKYLYIRNIQGDITSIIDSEGNKVCSYIYDGYGNHIVLNQDDNLENDPLSIGHINPFRYRGYYFDEESGLYYLNSRYYDPETGRFISPDVLSILDETKGQINGLNLYMYCNDNPIMYCDPSGNFAIGAFLIGLAISSLVGWGLSKIFGSQIAGGIGSIINGGSAIATGLSLFAFGPWGIIAGIGLMIVGGVTIAFGTNEIASDITGTNYIQSWTGWSEDLYNNLNIGFNIASSVGAIAGNIGMRIASNIILNNIMENPSQITNYKLWQIKTYGRYTTQWRIGTLHRGKAIGKGYTLTNVKGPNYGYIQWHPAGSTWHVNKNPYWKITSGKLGKIWFDYITGLFFRP